MAEGQGHPLVTVIIIILQQTWGEFQKIEKKIPMGFKVHVLIELMLVDFQRQFLDKKYQKFWYLKF